MAHKIYKHMPRGFKAVDPARNAKQARSLRAAYPKDANTIVVRTGRSRGKNRDVFPYHVATRNRDYF
jgi:hypothetical protein